MIELASMVEPGNVLPKELAIEFLSELDGMIQADIMLHGPEEIVVYDNEEQELLLRPPHDKIYIHYLVAMIRQVQQEFDAYNNAQEAVNEKLSAFETWYSAHYRPAVTMSREYMGAAPGGAGYGFAYLTAYGIAVKLGFEGTEAEWLLSLKGETGEAARMRYDADREMIQWGVQGKWYDLMALHELWDPVAAAIIDKAETAAEQAQESAHAASGAADDAAVHADTARAAAGNAEGHARTALAAAADAAGAAGMAAGNARETAGLAAAAEAAAGRAENAASSAQGGVESALKEHNNFKYSHQDIRWEIQGNKGSIGDLDRRKLDSEMLPAAIAGYLSENPITAEQVGAIPAEKYWDAVDSHNTDLAAHPYFHEQINELRNRLNTALNSDDIDLDQLAEIVAYIRSNRTLIDAITTSKVSVADIADNLVTDVADRPLSAAQGVKLRRNIEDLRQIVDGLERELGETITSGPVYVAQDTPPDDESALWIDTSDDSVDVDLAELINQALAQAKESGEFDGKPGADGQDGQPGKDGADGYTPVKGKDYFTPDDVKEIAEQAAELVDIPTGGGGSTYVLIGEILTEQVSNRVLIEIPDGITEILAFVDTPATDVTSAIYATAWSKDTSLIGNVGEVGLQKLSNNAMYLKMHMVKVGNFRICDYASLAYYPSNSQVFFAGGKVGDVSGNYFVFGAQYHEGTIPPGIAVKVYGR